MNSEASTLGQEDRDPQEEIVLPSIQSRRSHSYYSTGEKDDWESESAYSVRRDVDLELGNSPSSPDRLIPATPDKSSQSPSPSPLFSQTALNAGIDRTISKGFISPNRTNFGFLSVKNISRIYIPFMSVRPSHTISARIEENIKPSAFGKVKSMMKPVMSFFSGKAESNRGENNGPKQTASGQTDLQQPLPNFNLTDALANTVAVSAWNQHSTAFKHKAGQRK